LAEKMASSALVRNEHAICVALSVALGIFTSSQIAIEAIAADVQAQPQAQVSLLSPQGISAIASLLSAVLWPIVAVAMAITFRPDVVKFLGRVKKGKLAGIEFELDESEKEAIQKDIALAHGPTASDLARSERVGQLASEADDQALQTQLSELAAEYERVRAAEPPSNQRTRKMSAVVAKMRAVGEIAFRYRHKLSVSPSPGDRLLAVCSLQIKPDYEMIDWLVERVRVEKPFVGFQAIWALIQIANGPHAREYREQLLAALKKLSDVDFRGDPGRIDALKRLSAALATR